MHLNLFTLALGALVVVAKADHDPIVTPAPTATIAERQTVVSSVHYTPCTISSGLAVPQPSGALCGLAAAPTTHGASQLIQTYTDVNSTANSVACSEICISTSGCTQIFFAAGSSCALYSGGSLYARARCGEMHTTYNQPMPLDRRATTSRILAGYLFDTASSELFGHCHDNVLNVNMDSPSATFNAFSSEIIDMFLDHLDDIVDLQNLMQASSHVWRHLEHDRQTLARVDRMLENGSTHPQTAFSIYALAHLRYESPLLETYINDHGLDFLGYPTWAFMQNPVLESLPQNMTPLQVRGLLATSSAILATALRCIKLFSDRFHTMQPLTEWASFDVYADNWTDLPTGPRFDVPDTGPLRWIEVQRILKAFWMIHFARMFSTFFNRGAFDWSEDRVTRVSEMKPITIFNFEGHGAALSLGRDRSWDYFLDTLHTYLSAEEYLDEVKAEPQVPSIQDLPPLQRVEGDDQEWPTASKTMKHFARIFKEIRYQENGDGFRPWRRLGFAVWDTERLKLAGFMNDIRKDPDQNSVHWLSITRSEQLDRTRWLSVIREEDFPFVQKHRLTTQDDSESEEHPSDYDTDSYTWSP